MAAPIGNPTVRLTADTTQFVAGMARSENVMRRVEQTAIKSRSAISGLGSALRAPGLGRAAAFGNIGGAAASALGLGALGGGAIGIAATGVFLTIDAIANQFRRAAEEQRKQAVAASRAFDIIRTLAVPRGPMRDMEERRIEIERVANEQLEALNARRAIILQNIARTENALAQIQTEADYRRARGEFSPAEQRRINEQRSTQEYVQSVLKEDLLAVEQTIKGVTVELGQQLQEVGGTVEDLHNDFVKWMRESQQQSNQITTSLSRVATQMLLLQRRRER